MFKTMDALICQKIIKHTETKINRIFKEANLIPTQQDTSCGAANRAGSISGSDDPWRRGVWPGYLRHRRG